jgi:leucyl-tRNA synthetase
LVHKWEDAAKAASKTASLKADSVSSNARQLRRKTHQTIRRVAESFESLQFNTPVAALMELSNAVADYPATPANADGGDVVAVTEAVTALVLMLTPYAPHTSEELYSVLVGNELGILANGGRFPVYDEEMAKADQVEIPVQVNGKLRARVFASPDISDDDLRDLAFADAKVDEYVNGHDVVKTIIVPRRLVNIVVKYRQ